MFCPSRYILIKAWFRVEVYFINFVLLFFFLSNYYKYEYFDFGYATNYIMFEV